MVTQGPEYAWIFLNNSWIYLNMPKFAWLCLNLPEWLCLAFPHSFPHNCLSIWTRGYLFQSLGETGRYSLKEHEAVFWSNKVWFFYRNWKYLLCFLLYAKLFCKISNLLLPFWGHESWYTLIGFWNASNVHYILYDYFPKWCSVPFY